MLKLKPSSAIQHNDHIAYFDFVFCRGGWWGGWFLFVLFFVLDIQKIKLSGLQFTSLRRRSAEAQMQTAGAITSDERLDSLVSRHELDDEKHKHDSSSAGVP